MARKSKTEMPKNEVSMKSLATTGAKINEEIELIPDVEVLEELSDEAKKDQEKAISIIREKAMAIIDSKKIPNAMKAINAMDYGMDIFNDPKVWQKIKSNIKTPMDAKFLAETLKLNLQNVDSLLRMGSVNTDNDAGEFFVALQFGSGNNKTSVAIKKK